jgi:hypothetical protein
MTLHCVLQIPALKPFYTSLIRMISFINALWGRNRRAAVLHFRRCDGDLNEVASGQGCFPA